MEILQSAPKGPPSRMTGGRNSMQPPNTVILSECEESPG